MKNQWAVQDAKAKFSEFLNACIQNGPQIVTKRGSQTAVLITVDEWIALKSQAKNSLKSLLLSDEARGELVLPKRGLGLQRKPVKL
ncbi:MAG: type II toxin-antitoxin system Phd/YefM family antitoxin [Polynucleobacter sp.]|jgi:antitoxin Phd|uniref:type II toxin-antitoxin system prevent-host-death family antitoxin n=1 Tax=Polynucleobacter sp. TaxID=2029855 RepID=UPI0021700B7A|nr:type II toxin-antitoxin system prevent-host-death family antitoxin [Polynucleobacter sp.]MBU3670598.1 type II toxin-antitoxin system Phd/YefM family antitoxin [Polynucleobacter sp.]MCW1966419.1 type II toxin-antitoxin system prevent-host-death family antitoxin [Polynucleobacter sp.]